MVKQRKGQRNRESSPEGLKNGYQRLWEAVFWMKDCLHGSARRDHPEFRTPLALALITYKTLFGLGELIVGAASRQVVDIPHRHPPI